MTEAFFNGWGPLLRVIIVGVCAYAGLVFILRISGNRTLSKMNAFDFVVTVALGSTLSSILINKEVALADGLIALSLLIGLQFLVTWSSVRVPWVKDVVTGEPQLLLFQGRMREETLRRTRVTGAEVRAAVRSAGIGSMEEAAAVVLETDGSLSVLRAAEQPGPDSSLKDVHRG